MKEVKSIVDRYEELEDYFRNTIIPQLFIDANFILQKFTPPAMKQFSLSPAHQGQHLSDVKDHFRFPGFEENIADVIKTQEILEKEVQTTDLRWYQMNIIPYIRRRDGGPDGVVITFVDITSRITDLKEQERLIAEHEFLLDNLAHDIRNSVGSVKLAISALHIMPVKERNEMESVLGVADRGLKRMEKIINDLFEIRKEAYSEFSIPEKVSIENIVEDVRLSLCEEIRDSGARILLTAEVSEINFSRRKLRSVLHNLVGNAIKYKSPERKPSISIKTQRMDGHISITVSDNGLGIPCPEWKRIFEKYERLSDEIEGSGIGLFLVRQIVEKAGGTIHVTSEPEKGSEFIIRIKED